jgi:hypothetical protein
MPITSEPAPSLRPWASATGATPLRTMFNLTMPSQMLGQNRTFLLCWE